MTSRMALSLAVTTGYVLGRTKKGKLALALGGAAMLGRAELPLPGLAQVRGTARSLVSGPLEALADGLHDRTAAVQERLNDAQEPVRATAKRAAKAAPARRGGGGGDD